MIASQSSLTIGWALCAALHSRTASTTSSKDMNMRLRSCAITHVAALRTAPLADAFCLGFPTWAG